MAGILLSDESVGTGGMLSVGALLGNETDGNPAVGPLPEKEIDGNPPVGNGPLGKTVPPVGNGGRLGNELPNVLVLRLRVRVREGPPGPPFDKLGNDVGKPEGVSVGARVGTDIEDS